jgi:hypothetical protein
MAPPVANRREMALSMDDSPIMPASLHPGRYCRIVWADRSRRRRLVLSAKRCGARNRNDPDNDFNNNDNGFRVLAAHRLYLPAEASGGAWPRRRQSSERARPGPGSMSRRPRSPVGRVGYAHRVWPTIRRGGIFGSNA